MLTARVANSMGYMANKFEPVGGDGGSCRVRSKLHKLEHVWKEGVPVQ